MSEELLPFEEKGTRCYKDSFDRVAQMQALMTQSLGGSTAGSIAPFASAVAGDNDDVGAVVGTAVSDPTSGSGGSGVGVGGEGVADGSADGLVLVLHQLQAALAYRGPDGRFPICYHQGVSGHSIALPYIFHDQFTADACVGGGSNVFEGATRALTTLLHSYSPGTCLTSPTLQESKRDDIWTTAAYIFYFPTSSGASEAALWICIGAPDRHQFHKHTI
jgi:hypothetical protein